MNFAFFLLILTLSGQPILDGSFHNTLEECMATRDKAPAFIANYNASAENPDKIISYVAICAPLKKAPQDKAI